MKRIIVSVFLLVFTMSSGIALAQEETESNSVNWVSGIVESIQSGKENSLVSVKMQNGENFNFSAANQMLHGVAVGDRVGGEGLQGLGGNPPSIMPRTGPLIIFRMDGL